MKRVLFVVLAVLLLMSMVALPAAAQSSGDSEVIRKAAAAYLASGKSPTINAEDLWANINDGDTSNDPFILSVRSPEHYALGHIPGAVNIPYKSIAKPESLAKLPKNKQIVVYCYTGHTGQIATTILNMLGYDAINLKFGMMGWTKNDTVLATKRFGPTVDQNDYALETKANVADKTYKAPVVTTGGTSDSEIIRIAADKWLNAATPAHVVPASQVFENLNDGDDSNNPFIVSVRSPEHYALGHIPGAVNIPWKEIAKTENLAKLPTDKPIMVYCYTGHTGQVASTVLGLLGYQASNIKYGMMGWTKDDTVLATKRFGPDLQRDYRLEPAAGGGTAAQATAAPAAAAQPTAAPAAATAQAAAPGTLPQTGGSGLGLLIAGLALVMTGAIGRHRTE